MPRKNIRRRASAFARPDQSLLVDQVPANFTESHRIVPLPEYLIENLAFEPPVVILLPQFTWQACIPI